MRGGYSTGGSGRAWCASGRGRRTGTFTTAVDTRWSECLDPSPSGFKADRAFNRLTRIVARDVAAAFGPRDEAVRVA